MNEPIVKAGYGWDRTDPGPFAVVISSGKDLRLLCDRLDVSGDRYKRLFNSRLYSKGADRHRLSLAGPVIGAPYAVMVLETLIALGVKQVVYLGWCGSVSQDVCIGDVVIPTGCLIDEGTSRHYQVDEHLQSEPSLPLVQMLRTAAARMDCQWQEGTVWTTDGIFRETPEKIATYSNKGALAVEMELSALFTVGKFHRVDIAGILVVSDELSPTMWKPGFKTDMFGNGRMAAAEIICDLCKRQMKP